MSAWHIMKLPGMKGLQVLTETRKYSVRSVHYLFRAPISSSSIMVGIRHGHWIIVRTFLNGHVASMPVICDAGRQGLYNYRKHRKEYELIATNVLRKIGILPMATISAIESHEIVKNRWNIKVSKQSLRFLVSARVASDPRVGILFIYIFLLCMKRCPIATTIAGSIGILPCFFT